MDINWTLTCLCNDSIVDISFSYYQDRTCVWKDENGNILLRLVKHDIWWMEDGEAIQLVKQPLRLHTLYPCVVNKEQAYIFCEPQDKESRMYALFTFQKHQIYSIGRKQCDIVFDNEFISEHHADIYFEQNRWWIIDRRSTNGTYVNRKRISKCALQFGDCIYFMGLWMIFGDEWIAINNPLQRMQVNKQVCLPYKINEIETLERNKEERYFVKEERKQEEIKPYQIQLPPPFQKREKLPVLLMLGPSMTMGVASMMSAMFMTMQTYEQTNSIKNAYPSMIMSGSMLLSTMLWPYILHVYEKRKEEKNIEQRKNIYDQYLHQMLVSIQDDINKRKAFLCSIFPKEHSFIPLWKHRSFIDVSYLCLGYGNEVLSIPWENEQTRQITTSYDPLLQKREKFMTQPRMMQDVPIVCDRKDACYIAMDAPKIEALAYGNYILFQIANVYSPKQIAIVIASKEDIGILRFLPHLFHEKFRFLCASKQQVYKVLQRISELTIPIVIVSAHPIFTSIFLSAISKTQQITLLALHQERTLKQIKIEHDIAVFQNKEIMWKRIPQENWEKLIQEYKVDGKQSFPKILGFLEMYEVVNCEHLDIEKRWARAKPDQELRAPIGVYENHERCYLDIHEKAHGPHGILAGMTGSGKSEFLISLLLSFAIAYHPYDVSFVLIDYKGGGMAKTLESLPHTAGIITNLDGSMIERSLLALDSELLRRQKLFIEAMTQVEASSMDIYSYQNYCKEGYALEPLPHIIIAADEFAELKQQQPAFMEQLIRLARIGRSLGIHLLLATQKPSGVIDEQIWSNAHFHICMKVADKTDSMDMLKREDGAYLTNSGRFYLQVGYDELFEEGQAAYAKMPYQEGQRIEDAWMVQLDELANPLQQWKRETSKGMQKNEVQAILSHMQSIVEKNHIKPISLWLPQLQPYEISKDEHRTWIAVVDDPLHQRQFPLVQTIDTIENTLFYASNRKDHMQAIEALSYTLMFSYTVKQLCFIYLDMTSTDCLKYASYPHTYAYINEDEQDDMKYIFTWLHKQLQLRKKESYTQHIVVVLHHYAPFYEQYEYLDELFYVLLRDGKDYGIHMIVTLQSMQDIRYRYLRLFPQVFCFSLAKTEEIIDIVGVLKQLQTCVGRALWKRHEVFEVQFVTHEKNWLNHHLKRIQKYKTDRKMPRLGKQLKQALTWIDAKKQIAIGIQKDSRSPMLFQTGKPWIFLGPKAFALIQRIEHIHHQHSMEIKKYHGQEDIVIEGETASIIIYIPNAQLSSYVYTNWFNHIRSLGNLLWVGKGCKEMRYLLDFQEECADGEEFDGYWIGSSCIPIRFMEEP